MKNQTWASPPLKTRYSGSELPQPLVPEFKEARSRTLCISGLVDFPDRVVVLRKSLCRAHPIPDAASLPPVSMQVPSRGYRRKTPIALSTPQPRLASIPMGDAQVCLRVSSILISTDCTILTPAVNVRFF